MPPHPMTAMRMRSLAPRTRLDVASARAPVAAAETKARRERSGVMERPWEGRTRRAGAKGGLDQGRRARSSAWCPRFEAIAVGSNRTPNRAQAEPSSPLGDRNKAHGDGFEPWAPPTVRSLLRIQLP